MSPPLPEKKLEPAGELTPSTSPAESEEPEEEDGTPATPTDDTPVQQRRRVTWELVDGACETLMKRQPSMEMTQPLQSWRQKCARQCSQGFDTFLRFCADCCCPTTAKPPKRHGHRKRPMPKNRPGWQGYLWKLNSDADEEMQDLRSWRRRLFLQRSAREKGVGLAYLSEKRDGELTLACSLAGLMGESILPMKKIALDSPSPDVRYWATSNLHSYDVAFGFDDGRGLEACDELVPEQLYPFSITWVDVEQEIHTTVLAADSEEVRDKWISSLARKQQAANHQRRASARRPDRTKAG